MRWLRRKHDVPQVSGEDLGSPRWLQIYARELIFSTDTLLFLLAGLAVGLLSDRFTTIEVDGVAELLALAAIGFAALAVALTALSIFVSLVNDAYLRILDLSNKGGLPGYLVPFLSAGLISSIATIFGVVGAVVYPATPAWTKASILGLEVGFVVWAVWALFQIVVDVAMHGVGRYDLARAAEKPKMDEIAEIIRKHATPPVADESAKSMEEGNQT
jgi:hypothetical protein